MKPTMSFQGWCIQNHAYLLLHFYHEGKNPIPPDEIGFSSGKYARFRCHVCGLSWQRTLNHITNHPLVQTCPFCEHRKPSPFYNLATEYPELKEEWDNEKNLFPPETCLPHSNRSVYWRCAKNHRWKAAICDRTETADRARKSGFQVCPYCSKERISATYNLTTEYPEVSKEWNYIKNKGQKPEDFPPHSNQKVWWICSYDSSHQWQAKICTRTTLNRGCPQCAKEFKMSYPARALFYYLRKAYPSCVCEEPFQKYKMDLLLPDINLVLEHDGYYHHSSEADKKRAERKDYALRKAGYQVLRICDSKDLTDPVVSQDTKILYRYDERNQYLDQMIAATFRYLGAAPLDFNHRRDQYEINQMYFHERKKRTLAVEYPKIAEEWSPKNSNKPDTVLSGSPRKVWWCCPKCRQEYQATIASRTKNHSNCPFCANLRAYTGNCLATLRPEIATQWYFELNLPLTPYDVVPGSEKEVYWKCPNGHTWKSAISSRTSSRESRCPICYPRTMPRRRSAQPMDSTLVQIWHPTKNLPLVPDNVANQSNKKFWWQCEKGHEWQSSPSHLWRLSSSKRCPFCNDHAVCTDNSLLTRSPELAQEWDRELNFPLTPDQVLYCSGKKYWWRRGEFVWQASVKDRLSKGDCIPRSQYLIYNQHLRLSVTHPDLAEQWDSLKNDPLTPDQVTARSGKKVWWHCKRGHTWQTTISKRIRGDGCPYCSGHRPSKEYCLQTCYPAIAAQWHPEKNEDITPWDVTPKSGKAVWWRCERGHEWRTSISNRSSRGHNCPYCADHSKKLGSIAEERPALIEEWDYERNVGAPQEHSARSNKKVWWKCIACGHNWQTSPDSRFSGSGCPVCARKRHRVLF